MSKPLATNDEDGIARCSLCDWQYACRTIEEIEFRVKKHLQEEHGLTLLYRQDNEGNQTEIP